jgi:hypothetical protein
MRISRGQKKRPSVATLSDPAFGAPGTITAELRHLREAGTEAFKKFGMERVPRLSQRVVVPRSFFANTDQAGASQIGEVPGRRWLRNAKDGNQVTDAQLAFLQQMQNPQARAVRERTKEAIDWKLRGL